MHPTFHRRIAAPVLVLLLVLGSSLLLATGDRSGAQTTPPPTVVSGVLYGDPGDTDNTLDVYRPTTGTAPHPAIVVVHGGGWTGGDPSDVAPDAAAFAEAGFVAFNIEYDDNGPTRWPNELLNVQQAVRWVQDNAATYGVDPNRIGLFGSSAGGNLVMLVGVYGLGAPGQYNGNAGERPPVRAIAAWSGPTDVTVLAPTNLSDSQLSAPPAIPIPGEQSPAGCAGDTAACLATLGPQYLQAYMNNCNINDCRDQYVAASPALLATSATPPMFLANATEDLVPLEQAFEMVDALTLNGVTSRLLVVEGEQHADSYRSTALQPTIDFFNAFVAGTASTEVAITSTPTTVAGSAALPPLVDGNLLPAPNLSLIQSRAATDPVPPTVAANTGTTPSPVVLNAERRLQTLDVVAIVMGFGLIFLFLVLRRRRHERHRQEMEHLHPQDRPFDIDGARRRYGPGGRDELP